MIPVGQEGRHLRQESGNGDRLREALVVGENLVVEEKLVVE